MNTKHKEHKKGTHIMAKATKKEAGKSLKAKSIVKTIDQMSIARQISAKLGYKISDILTVVEEEQKLTMEYAKMGYKVIKKNYLTIEGRKFEGKKHGNPHLMAKPMISLPKPEFL